MSHTPGPWRVGHWEYVRGTTPIESEFVEGMTVIDGKDRVITTVPPGHRTTKMENVLEAISTGYGGETDLDAKQDDLRLMAAAPDLLEASKIALEVLVVSDTVGLAYQVLRAAIAKAEGK